MLIIFFSIDNLLLLLSVQAVHWKYYWVKKNLLIQEVFSIPYHIICPRRNLRAAWLLVCVVILRFVLSC